MALRPMPNSRRQVELGLSLCFVLGFTTVFVLLGASATVLSRLLRMYLSKRT